MKSNECTYSISGLLCVSVCEGGYSAVDINVLRY